MLNTVKLLSVFATLVLLNACTTLNKDECLNANWKIIGYEDGAHGHPPDRIGEHRQACAKHNIVPDMNTYQQGHAEGMRRFCQPRNGYQQGQNGYQYNGGCPQDLEPAFVQGHKTGAEIYAVKNRINATRSQQNNAIKQIKQVEDDISAKEKQIVLGNTTPAQRLLLLQDLKQLSQTKSDLENDVHNLDITLHDLNHSLDYLLSHSPYQ
jgi:hypothetical protein